MNLDFSYRVSQIKADSAIPTQGMSREFQESTTLVLSEPCEGRLNAEQPWGPSHSAVRISIKSLARPHVCEEASRLFRKHIKRTHIFLFLRIFPLPLKNLPKLQLLLSTAAMCRWRQIQDHYAQCDHSYRLPDEMVYCPDRWCKFSPYHVNEEGVHVDRCGPECTTTCWQYRQFPEQIFRRLDRLCVHCQAAQDSLAQQQQQQQQQGQGSYRR